MTRTAELTDQSASTAKRRRRLLILLIVLVLFAFLFAAYTWITLHVAYSPPFNRGTYWLCTEDLQEGMDLQDLGRRVSHDHRARHGATDLYI
jgi:flagellar basal body-associated protein FliL